MSTYLNPDAIKDNSIELSKFKEEYLDNAYKEINHGTLDTTFTLTPNTFHVWDEVSELTLTLGEQKAGVINEYLFQFTSGSTPAILNLSNDIIWSDKQFIIEANKIYQISILRGLGSVSKWSKKFNKIWYTSTDGNIVTPNKTDVFGANIVSNTYENGKGIIKFDDNVTSIGGAAFRNCSSLTSITIPDSVTSIGNSAFDSCKQLTSITIPDSVTSIGNSAFIYCSGLTAVTIGNGVTSIGSSAFTYCTGLTSINIPDSVTSIGGDAFRNCSRLTSITIPDSVTSIGIRVFSSCSGLTSVIVSGDNSIYDSRNNCNAIIKTSTNELIVGCKTTVIPDSVTSIGNYAFTYCTGLTSINIPDSVTSIGDRAFESCSGLTSVNIPDSVTSIGDYTFYDCSGLTEVTIGSGVTSIGDAAIAYCSNLTSVRCYPTTPPTLGGSYVFDDNAADRKIYVPSDSVDTYKTASGWSEYADKIEGYSFTGNPS